MCSKCSSSVVEQTALSSLSRRPRARLRADWLGHALPGSGDQAAEQAEVIARLRMPLHCEHEGTMRVRGGELRRLDDSVRRPRSRRQARAELVNGLVVMGRHGPVRGAQNLRKSGIGGDAHLVTAVSGILGRVAVMADQAGQVMMKSPDE